MSHETFPTPESPAPSKNARHTIHATDTQDTEQVVQWFREAMEAGYDFAYHRKKQDNTPRRLMLIAEGLEASTVMRVLLDDYSLKDE